MNRQKLLPKKIVEIYAGNIIVQTYRPARIALPGQRAVVVTDQEGHIVFATRHAMIWLDKRFPLRRDLQRLPLALRRWLERAAPRNKTFVVTTSRDRLSITLIDDGTPNARCLLLEKIDIRRPKQGVTQRLSAREAEVLCWVARGKSNSQIATVLKLQTGTVKKHLQRIYPKLGVENRTAAASFASILDDAD